MEGSIVVPFRRPVMAVTRLYYYYYYYYDANQNYGKNWETLISEVFFLLQKFLDACVTSKLSLDNWFDRVHPRGGDYFVHIKIFWYPYDDESSRIYHAVWWSSSYTCTFQNDDKSSRHAHVAMNDDILSWIMISPPDMWWRMTLPRRAQPDTMPPV